MYGGEAICSTRYEQPMPKRVPGKHHSYSDHEAVCATLELGPSTIQNCTNDQPVVEILNESCTVLDNALRSLRQQETFYLSIFLILFAVLCSSSYWSQIDVPWPLSYLSLPSIIIQLIRILITTLMIFAFVMATLWNRIEHNAIRGTISAMKLQLNNLQSL